MDGGGGGGGWMHGRESFLLIRSVISKLGRTGAEVALASKDGYSILNCIRNHEATKLYSIDLDASLGNIWLV